MSAQEIPEAVLDLPAAERLERARRIVASVALDESQAEAITEAVRWIEAVLTGKVRGLREEEFRAALK